MDVSKIERREFFSLAGRRGLQIGLAGVSLPALLAACSKAVERTASPRSPSTDGSRAIVGDVLEYDLEADGWTGAFGSVTFRLHRGTFAGKDVYFIRTDASDKAFADREKLVFVPKMGSLRNGSAGTMYLFEDAKQPAILSSEPGRSDYTPAWRIAQVRWTKTARVLGSAEQLRAAATAGELAIQETDIVLNAPVVKWSGGEMPVDTVRTEYLGPGQLLSAPDTNAMKVTFKLHECYPGARYIVTDTDMAPMAAGMNVVHSPRLSAAPKASATGRVNVFMNGTKGSGPMGFQASVFDSRAGEPAWSPYWDHMTYGWKQGASARILKDERAIHAARDGKELDEFRGTPDTKGAIFTVNCPVPVLAPNSA